jgi:hypothetical protein
MTKLNISTQLTHTLTQYEDSSLYIADIYIERVDDVVFLCTPTPEYMLLKAIKDSLYDLDEAIKAD